MLLNDEEIQERIESPLNLLNRLREKLGRDPKSHPALPPKAEDVISDLEDKISSTTAKSKAREIMNLTMDELKGRISEVKTPEALARIAREMSTVVGQQEAKSPNESGSKIIVYAPQVLSLENYNIVDVSE